MFDSLQSILQGALQQGISIEVPLAGMDAGSLVSDGVRKANYLRFLSLYDGNFRAAFPTVDDFVGTNHVNANLASRCVGATAGAVWPKCPKPSSDDQGVTDWVDALVSDQRWDAAFAKNIEDTALFGDGILLLSVRNGRIIIKTINPIFYRAEVSLEDADEAIAHNIEFPESVEEPDFLIHDRYWFNGETGTWWRTRTRREIRTNTESNPLINEDMMTRFSPVIHTFERRISGAFYGKPRMNDCFWMIGAFAAMWDKIHTAAAMNTTQALPALPWPDAFDEQGNVVWTPDNPLRVDTLENPTWDKNKWGWIAGDGSIIQPSLSAAGALEMQVYLSMGISPSLFGQVPVSDAGGIGIERLNLNMQQMVDNYHRQYAIFLNDLMDAAGDLARNVLGVQLPDALPGIKWTWASFVPEDETTRIANVVTKIQAGLSQQQALIELGYTPEEAAKITAQRQAEQAAAAPLLPHGHLLTAPQV